MPTIEPVQAPLMHARPWLSLGKRLPRIVVHVHAYNFFTGTDLRVGLAGGSEYYIDRMWQKLTFSSGWVSRILQNALAFQLSDPTALADVRAYVDTCRQRHTNMLDSLKRVGFDLPRTDGPTIWPPVRMSMGSPTSFRVAASSCIPAAISRPTRSILTMF